MHTYVPMNINTTTTKHITKKQASNVVHCTECKCNVFAEAPTTHHRSKNRAKLLELGVLPPSGAPPTTTSPDDAPYHPPGGGCALASEQGVPGPRTRGARAVYNEDELTRIAGLEEEVDAVWEAEDAAVMRRSKKGRAVATKVVCLCYLLTASSVQGCAV